MGEVRSGGVKICFLAGILLLGFNGPPDPAIAQGGFAISLQLAPPALPDYDQPPLPEAGYLWTPGYWAYGDDGYYWVPGTWVEPPAVGLLWTPPYWGWGDGGYRFHDGYWGDHVGYYGGVNYGYGYGGDGYHGGRWQNGAFAYNRAGNNLGNVAVTNVYQERIVEQNRSRVSFNGGQGGLRTQPSPTQRQYEQERHLPVTAQQAAHNQGAAANPGLSFSHNQTRPAIAATQRAAQFEGAGVIAPRPAPALRPVQQPVRNVAPAPRPVPEARPPAERAVEHEQPAHAQPQRAEHEPARVQPQREEHERPDERPH